MVTSGIDWISFGRRRQKILCRKNFNTSQNYWIKSHQMYYPKLFLACSLVEDMRSFWHFTILEFTVIWYSHFVPTPPCYLPRCHKVCKPTNRIRIRTRVARFPDWLLLSGSRNPTRQGPLESNKAPGASSPCPSELLLSQLVQYAPCNKHKLQHLCVICC